MIVISFDDILLRMSMSSIGMHGEKYDGELCIMTREKFDDIQRQLDDEKCPYITCTANEYRVFEEIKYGKVSIHN